MHNFQMNWASELEGRDMVIPADIFTLCPLDTSKSNYKSLTFHFPDTFGMIEVPDNFEKWFTVH